MRDENLNSSTIKLSLRRSPRSRLSGPHITRSHVEKVMEKTISVGTSNHVDKVRTCKRKSDQALTPLRKEVGETDRIITPRKPVFSMLELANPISAMRLSQVEEFNFLGLPHEVRQIYIEKRKITQLYDWQKDCLSDYRLVQGTNCIVSLPTGAGKTLIAEILILRQVIVKKLNCILILPYVSIVQEKISALCLFEDEFDIRIEEYAATKGRFPPIKRRKDISVYVATIEKANMLINSLIEKSELDRIGLIVVDELHMIGDGSRGAIIEQTLTKYMHQGSGQIVGMSATLSNMDQLAKFMKAYVYTTNFRPVELKEYVRIGQAMWRVHPGGRLIFDADLPPNKLVKADPDGICQLLQGVIPDKSVIIFCPTKKNCESVALLISRCVPRVVRDAKIDARKKLVDTIKEDNDGKIDSQLEISLLSGVAYHHSGLTHDERKHIESAYVDGILCVVCATSTLAAGVNLPARRVIIKSPTIGRHALGKAQYMQMIGRAGRAGYDKKGDSITIVRPGVEEKQFRSMLCGPVVSCSSSLSESSIMASFILDLVTLKIANSVDSLIDVIRYSLLYVQVGNLAVKDIVTAAVRELKMEKLFVEDKENCLAITELGSATFSANLAPKEAQKMNKDLMQSLNGGLVFSSHFHLLFTIVPYDAVSAVDWDVFHAEYLALAPSEKNLLSTLGLPEKRILQYILCKKQLEAGHPAIRLYIALMLQKIWNQEPHWSVAERFGVERGWMQSTLQGAIAQASAIAKFSEKLSSFWPLRLLIPELVQRLSDCIHMELIPLMSIDGVKRKRAHQLYAAGYKTVAIIAKADYNNILNDIANLSKFQAVRIINSAKTLLRDQMDEKMEEMEALGIDLNQFKQRMMT